MTPSAMSRIATLARANESLGELSALQMEGVAELVSAVEQSLPEVLAAADDWEPYSIKGMYVQPLRFDREENRVTALVRLTPGTHFPPHQHDQGEQCVVLYGELAIGERSLRRANIATGSLANPNRPNPPRMAACSW